MCKILFEKNISVTLMFSHSNISNVLLYVFIYITYFVYLKYTFINKNVCIFVNTFFNIFMDP